MTESIVLAAGCFWGVEDLIRAVPGVADTEVGYCGGHHPNPTYESVKTGQTGHAEAVKIVFDPAQIPLSHLFELFFKLHDPTTLHRQGNDVGTQYRSAIFIANESQKEIAEKAVKTALSSGAYTKPITTTIEPLTTFYSAETYHQDYLQKNPNGYTCHYWRGSDPE